MNLKATSSPWIPLILVFLTIGCVSSRTTQPLKKPINIPTATNRFIGDSPEGNGKDLPAKSYRIPVVSLAKRSFQVPENSKIVVTGLAGPCSSETRNALLHRLTENADYDVLTRDYLEQIKDEIEGGYEGFFNTHEVTEAGHFEGASYFVVGRITYCGREYRKIAKSEKEQNLFIIRAFIQMLDLKTGKVLLSTAGEGSYKPIEESDPTSTDDYVRLISSSEGDFVASHVEGERKEGTLVKTPHGALFVENEEPTKAGRRKKKPKRSPGSPSPLTFSLAKSLVSLAQRELPPAYQNEFTNEVLYSFQDTLEGARQEAIHDRSHLRDLRRKDMARDAGQDPLTSETKPPKSDKIPSANDFYALKAAEDFANRFADRFFVRPAWEELEMWTHPGWHYGDSVRYVKLGHCSRAVTLLESVGAQELHTMPEPNVAQYLHNYGVALLCDNQIEKAMEKLRASYRITYGAPTKRMLSIAGRVQEWDLEIQVESEPEIDLLLERPTNLSSKRRSVRPTETPESR